jgi:iron complex outermembrane recepter protein
MQSRRIDFTSRFMKTPTLLLFLLLTAPALFAQEEKTVNKDSLNTLQEVVLTNPNNKLNRTESATVAKMPLKNLENPQVYNIISADLFKEQAITNFNEALRNATGVTRLWESTGRGDDGSEYYSMRGFAVQPTMVNGLPGLTNGSLDPANVDNIEVIKGPSGTLFGSSVISYGGLINVVTKKPYSGFGGEIGYNSGTYGLDRVTADVNVPLSKTNDIVLRVNSAWQKENSFQDAGFSRSLFFAPTLAYKMNDKLSFLINTEITARESANAPMLFLNRYGAVSFNSIDLFENNYKRAFTSNELTIKNPAFLLQAQMAYKLSDEWTSQTVLSRSNTKADGYYHYLWDDLNGDTFTRYITKLNAETVTTDIQQNFIGDFKIGQFRNRIVAGIDYYAVRLSDNSTGYAAAGQVSLVNGTDSGDLTQAGVDNALAGTAGPIAVAESEVYSAYVSDVFNITPTLSAMASLRVDHFTGKTATWLSDDADSSGQTAISPKFGIVYQPIKDKLSVFANFMNGFKNIEPSRVIDPVDPTISELFTFDPEHANQFEIGVKTNIYQDRIAITASYYHINVKNKVLSTGFAPTQNGEVESKGFELNVIANPVNGLNIVAGFSHNDSEVLEDNPADGYVGMRPEEAGPETTANLWANYTLTAGKMKGFGFGFGGNYASEFLTLNRSTTGSFELPSYTIVNAALSYNVEKFHITLKLNNAFNEKYYSGWSTVTPQRLRSVVAGLTYKF